MDVTITPQHAYTLEHNCLVMNLHSDLQLIPASSLWTQLWMAVNWQSKSLVSFPTQATSSRRIEPFPWPKYALEYAVESVINE